MYLFIVVIIIDVVADDIDVGVVLVLLLYSRFVVSFIY